MDIPSLFWKLANVNLSSVSSFQATQFLVVARVTTKIMQIYLFYCGEYLQLIDANQDNYLEECLKICNVLEEFEYSVSHQSPYAVAGHKGFTKPPIAIIVTHEYIFSGNIGILGDIASGKEQTFGTLATH
jgi:hypothetical protein